MSKFVHAAAAALSLLATISARADYVVKDGQTTPQQQTFGSFALGGIQFPKHVMVDPATGAAIGVSGAPMFVQVTNFPATQAISATALPLPVNAATAAGQATGNAALGSPTDAAWDGSASSASITAILKGLPRTAGGGGGGGASGSVTAAGTNGTTAQAVQGITGGIPQNSFPAQYNSTLPTLASGATGYLAVDTGGRLILSPGGSISIANFPATQTVAGSVAVSALPALPAGTNGIGSVAVSALPALPAGANTIGSVAVTALPALPAGTNAIGSVQSNLQIGGAAVGSGHPIPVSQAAPPTGAALAAKQPALGTAGTPSADVLSMQGVTGGTPLPADTVVRSLSTDRGGTITTGGTAQQFMTANATRRGFTVQNQSTGDLYINCVATAAVGPSSLRVPAGALYESSPHHVGTGACSIIGATTAQAFYAREF